MQAASFPESGNMTLREYLHVLWRWKWVIVVAVCASTFAAYVYSSQQPRQYMATAELIYVEPIDPTSPLGPSYSSDARDLAVQDVINVMGSPLIAGRAQTMLDKSSVGPYGISTSVSGGSVSGTGGVIDVSATSASARDAAAVANAYAQAVVTWRKAQQLDRVALAERAVRAKLSGFTSGVSRRTTDYIMLKQNLQNLKLLEMTVSGDFQLVTPAAAPVVPFAPQPGRSGALGMGVGLLAGVGLAFLFNQLTTKVRGQREAGEVLGLPVVGSLPEIPRRALKDGRLIALTHPSGRSAEALRLLRSNLDYVNVDDVSSLLVTSALADEGKSMTVCNLAVTMAMAGKKVVVVDGDLRRPRVHEYFGLPNDVGLSSVAAGDVTLAEALKTVDLPPTLRPGGDNGSRPDAAARARNARRLVVLTSGPFVPDPGELVASKRFGSIIRELQTASVDFVIVDSPALMEVGDAAAMAAQVEGLVMVVSLDKARHTTLVEARHLLAPLPCKKLGAILVRAKSGPSGYYAYSD